MRLIGQMASMAIVMIIFTIVIGHVEIAPANYDQFLTCAKIAFSIFAVMCAIGIAFSLFRGKLLRD